MVNPLKWVKPSKLIKIRTDLTPIKNDRGIPLSKTTGVKKQKGVVAKTTGAPLSKTTDEVLPIEGLPLKDFPEGEAADAAADIDPIERRIWTEGVELLTRDGNSNDSARRLLGKWCSDHGKIAVAQAIAVSQAENPADTKAYIGGILRRYKQGKPDMQVGKSNGDDNFIPEPPCVKCGSDVCLGGQSCTDRAAAKLN